MVRKLFFLLNILLISQLLKAQTTFFAEDTNAIYLYQVRSMDEFIKVFNSCLEGIDSTENVCWKTSLPRLFDLQKESWDTLILAKFINDYSERIFNKIRITDNGWYALVTCSVKYKGTSKEIKLTLSPEKNKYGGYMWAITGIDADFLSTPSVNDTIFGLSPVSESINFKDIYKLFKSETPVMYYVSPERKADDVSIFLYCIQNNEIEFNEVVEIEHYFFQFNNWTIVVKNFDRQSSNAGWLIADIYQASDDEKRIFITNNLSIQN